MQSRATTVPLKKRPPRTAEEEKGDEEFAVNKPGRSNAEQSNLSFEAEQHGWDSAGRAEDSDVGRFKEEEEGDEERIDREYLIGGEEAGEEEEPIEQFDRDEDGGAEQDGFEEVRHDVAKERRRRKEFEVFIGGLDRDANEEDLRQVFSQVGEITEVRLMMNPITNKNKGFAFVRFATVEQSRRAINELKHPVINGKQCGVAPSQDSDTLFVGNICREWTKEILKEKLARYGVEFFEELTLVEDTRNEGMNRGFAFLGFSSRADAVEACKRLQRRDVVFGTERTARVAFADTFIEPDDEIMSQVRAVFIDGLPSTWDEDRVKDHLEQFGRIEKIELARNMPAAKRTDFGFVTFSTHVAAVACIDAVNGSEITYGYSKIKVRARLSRPRQRGKSTRHARGGYPVGQSGGRDSWGSSVSHMDTWRSTGPSERGIPSRKSYDGGLKRSYDYEDRRPSGDYNRTGSRRQFLSPDRYLKQRSPVSTYGQSSSKRDYMRQDESFSRPDFVRVSDDGQSYRDPYLSRRSRYMEDSPKRGSRAAARRISPLYGDDDDDGYEYIERSSGYRNSHNRDYSSSSGLKRPYPAVDEAHPRYTELPSKQSRPRYDYGTDSGFPYNDNSYGSDSKRLGRGSRSGYDRGGRSSRGRGFYERTSSSLGYRRDAMSRDDTVDIYSRYDRELESGDYIPSRLDMGEASYPPAYSSRRTSGRTNEEYAGGSVSDSYY